MKRALLIWNPTATTTTPAVRDVIARALGSEMHVEIAETEARHHATDLAADAAKEGSVDVVAVLGGDGTVNEAVNGLAGSDVALAAIPGGGTNVFARILGYPRDPIEATSALLATLKDGSSSAARRIPLGRVNGRAFAFCAGAGFDAHVVADVEASPVARRLIGESFFIASALKRWVTPSRARSTSMTLRWDGGVAEGVRILICGNADPYTFFGPRPVHLVPTASLEKNSLDLTAIQTLAPPQILQTIASMFMSGAHHPTRGVVQLQDLAEFEISSDEPVPLQVDGDIAGESTNFRFCIEPDALTVIGSPDSPTD